MINSKNKIAKSTQPRIGYNCISAEKERTQLQPIPEYTYNNTLPKPLVQRNMKLQQLQIKKNISLLPQAKLLSAQQTKQNIAIFQQTLPATQQIPVPKENNHKEELNKTLVSTHPLLIKCTKQQTRRGMITNGGQHQQRTKQVLMSDKQRQSVETHWFRQKQSLMSTIHNLTQKLQVKQIQNINLRNLLYPKHSSSSSPLQFLNQSSSIVQQHHYSQMSTQLVSRILNKVEMLQQELNYFINLSCQLKEIKERLEKCEEALRVSQEKVTFYETQFHNSSAFHNNQPNPIQQQHQQVLLSQLANYQLQYDQLKRQNFLLQQQYRNSTHLNTLKQQSLQQQYNELMQKYHQLYESYRKLYYQEGRSHESSSGFINQVNESIELERKNGERSLQMVRDVITVTQQKRRPSQNLLYYHSTDDASCPANQMKASCQKLFHYNSSQHPDSEDIAHPIQSPDECKNDLDSTQPTRIILSELIRQTLEITS